MTRFFLLIIVLMFSHSKVHADSVEANIHLIQPTSDGALRISFSIENSSGKDVCIDKRLIDDSFSLLYPGIEIKSVTRGELGFPNFGTLVPTMPVRLVKIPPNDILFTSYLLGADWIHGGILEASGDTYRFRISIVAIPCEIEGEPIEKELPLSAFSSIFLNLQETGGLIEIVSEWSQNTYFKSEEFYPLDR